jgi:hypothetical protein
MGCGQTFCGREGELDSAEHLAAFLMQTIETLLQFLAKLRQAVADDLVSAAFERAFRVRQRCFRSLFSG